MRILLAVRPLAFVVCSALIMVVGSERIFWYYVGAGPLPFIELALFYALPVSVLFWFFQRYRVSDVWSFLVAVPVFGYIIEGVITPVIYSGGPNPFFPVWFTGWHGGLAVVALWYLVRRWVVADRRWSILGLATGLGLFWGTWATTMKLPESLDDPEQEVPTRILSSLEFAEYAAIVGAVLIAGHLLLGHGLWLTEVRFRRWVEVLMALAIAPMVIAYTVAIPWAGPMFAVLLATVAWPLRRHRRIASGPTIFERLAGPISHRALAGLVAMPIAAAASYAAWDVIDPSEDVIRGVFFYGSIGVQTVVAGVVMIWSSVRVVRRSRRHDPVPPPPRMPPPPIAPPQRPTGMRPDPQRS